MAESFRQLPLRLRPRGGAGRVGSRFGPAFRRMATVCEPASPCNRPVEKRNVSLSGPRSCCVLPRLAAATRTSPASTNSRCAITAISRSAPGSGKGELNCSGSEWRELNALAPMRMRPISLLTFLLGRSENSREPRLVGIGKRNKSLARRGVFAAPPSRGEPSRGSLNGDLASPQSHFPMCEQCV